MLSNPRFWIYMAIFQVAFGLAVFSMTRNYYLQDKVNVSAAGVTQSSEATDWLENSAGSELEQMITEFPGTANSMDPFVLADQADEAFGQQQFDRAADLYHQLLLADPNNVDTYNNLGITLHYLGRSAEALSVLNEGIKADPAYQRIWLTLGFVNSQLGNVMQAQSALTTAVDLGADTEVGQSAAEMLRALGPD